MTILDTNVLSELMRPNPSAEVLSWIGKQTMTELCTTSITEAEIFYGIEVLATGRRRQDLLAAAQGVFTEDFGDRIFAFDSAAARMFAQLAAHRRAMGKPINHADAQIAAIARAHNAQLATRNVADFRDCGIEVIDPWVTSHK
jgi:hypothetical protein